MIPISPGAVEKLVVHCGSAAVCTANLANREAGMNRVENFLLCYGFFETPGIRVPYVHVLDEPHLEAVVPRELDQIQDLIVVECPE